MEPSRSARKQVLLAIFVVSGFTGLIYESIWSHYLKLFLGHAAYAQTLVLAIFMGGMALGSWLVATYSTRIRQLLLGYVVVEGVIGVLGLVFHALFVGMTDWSFDAVIPGLHSVALVHAYKWSLAAVLILPQSILLGMTFPLISGGVIRRWPDRPGATLSMLYFTNSLGASIGVLVSGFVLIRAFGLPGTIMTAGLLNVALALAVWAVVRRQVEPTAQPAASPAAAGRPMQWFVAAAFLTGAASFLYEIAWIRMLSLVLGSSTHSFELMLSAFIFGLACGGFWMRKRIDRLSDPVRYLGFVMVAMGALALLTLPAYNGTFDFMAWALRAFTRTDGGYTAFNITSQAVALAVMLPATFCAGMTLPLITHALLRRTGAERAIGTIYAANTLGAIVGVLLAVHLVMPHLGVRGAIIGGALVHMSVGFSALIWIAASRPRLPIGAAAAAAVLVLLIGIATNLDPLRMTSAVYRTTQASLPMGTMVRYLRHGKTATISVVEKAGTVQIATNGKPDATIQMGPGPAAADEITMTFAAALPLSMHANPERIANVGFGSGLTSHTVLGSPRVKILDSIEIEPFMVEAARDAFYARIHRVFEDPRSRIVYEDAKTFFASTREPYDIIISEPSNPWVSGVATLFSEEFYERVGGYLKPDGFFVQWLQIYETDISIIASVLKAMSPHFPTYAIYSTDDANVLILATRAAQLPEENAAIFDSPLLRSELARVGITSLGDIQQRRIADQRTIHPLFRSYPVPANSDYFPYVDLNAPRLRFMNRTAIELPGLLTLPVPVLSILESERSRPERIPASATGQLSRDVYVRAGRRIRDALQNGGTDGLEPALARDVLLTNMSAAQCREPKARDTWRRAVRELANMTGPYLTADELELMWRSVRERACYRDFAGSHRQWVDFLAAVASRQADAIIATAGVLLSTEGERSTDEEHALLIIATSAARLSRGEVAEARELLEGTWQRRDYPANYELSLRQLLALCHAGQQSAVTAFRGQ
jgi:spermidine synthase